MSAATAVRQPSTDIVAIVDANPVLVLTDREKFNQFYEAIREETDALDADVTTEKGRKAIASMAYKVARTKTAIDDAGKKLNEDARARINAVDEARREIRAQLDALKDEVRKPLTDWEDAEKEREEAASQEMASIRGMGRVDIDDDAATVQERIDALSAMKIDPAIHGAAVDLADNMRKAAIATLTDAHARLVREEQERAELIRLREQQAERDRAEAERLAKEQAKREARESEERAAAEAKAAEARRAEAAKAEAERIERERQAAAEGARLDAEAEAERQRAEAARAAQAEIDAANERTRKAEAAAQAERDRAAAAEAERQRIADQEAAEQAKREADRAHRGKVMGEAKSALMETCELDEAAAKTVVLAITAGNIPHIAIRF